MAFARILTFWSALWRHKPLCPTEPGAAATSAAPVSMSTPITPFLHDAAPAPMAVAAAQGETAYGGLATVPEAGVEMAIAAEPEPGTHAACVLHLDRQAAPLHRPGTCQPLRVAGACHRAVAAQEPALALVAGGGSVHTSRPLKVRYTKGPRNASRLVISGRLADVCAELDRLALLEQRGELRLAA